MKTVNGMDSSRGGPLSTLILMLPLIVVPALVVLRPSEQDSGFASDDLAAVEGDDFFTEEDGFGSGSANSDLGEPSFERPRSAELELLDAPFPDFDDEPGSPVPNRDALTAGGRRPAAASPSAPGVAQDPNRRRTPDLSRWGVTRSVWFTNGSTGEPEFAVFVPAKNNVLYRFAASGASERRVVEDVVRQIEEWQSEQAPPLAPETN